ncbi:aminopeptidase P family protein [Egibacter rhizosphaerae]|uniref:Aminopeptidase P family protein n=1 Tax=Egibacter rhizosphaerae TaxID=1670831 RepID=A0A411YGL8_9ACTN|nr:Xaa-Pro peptidase family protein [Egibacter rhizosphaerae]QBI20390.1 aminopeptidase P family protein [Egibacter rhizosphaerae]
MEYPRDEERLSRVRSRMADEDVDALVCSAPDNVVYLGNYWTMKGWEVLVFPREGEPTLIAVEPQAENVARNAWVDDVRYFAGYDPGDPRPPHVRALDLALEVLAERGLDRRVGAELSGGTQGADRMVGEPTVPWKDRYDRLEAATGELADATPLLVRARMRKTPQEIERLRRTNRLAGLAVDHVRERISADQREPDVGGMYEAFVHSEGIGFEGTVEMARAFTLAWSGPGISTFTATGNRPIQPDQPTLLEIWVCADGYWNDLTKNACPGPLTPAYERLLDDLLGIMDEVTRDHVHPGAPLGEVDRLIRARITEAGHTEPSHFVCHGVGARAHEPPWAHQAVDATMEEGMVLAIEPGCYWDGGGGLRLEDNFLVTADGCERLCPAPDDFRR